MQLLLRSGTGESLVVTQYLEREIDLKICKRNLVKKFLNKFYDDLKKKIMTNFLTIL